MKTPFLKRQTIYGETTVYFSQIEEEKRYQGLIVDYWRSLYDSVKNKNIILERGYAKNLILAEQKLESMKTLLVMNQ